MSCAASSKDGVVDMPQHFVAAVFWAVWGWQLCLGCGSLCPSLYRYGCFDATCCLLVSAAGACADSGLCAAPLCTVVIGTGAASQGMDKLRGRCVLVCLWVSVCHCATVCGLPCMIGFS